MEEGMTVEQAMAENTRMLWVWMAWIRRLYHGRTAQTEDGVCMDLGARKGREDGWEYGNWRAGRNGDMETRRRGNVAAVDKPVDKREESTQRINDRIIEKEMRRSADGRWSDHAEAVECARGAAAKYVHPHLEDPDWQALYRDGYFVDDVKGGTLDKEQVIQARKLEMTFFRKMGVYRKMSKSKMPPGARTISTKWVDTNKGTDEEPNYRSRLVGREIEMDDRPDLFAATPPLESLRYILSLCASTQGTRKPHRVLSVDVKRAYFYAPARRSIFIELPAEDRLPGDEDQVASCTCPCTATGMQRRTGP